MNDYSLLKRALIGAYTHHKKIRCWPVFYFSAVGMCLADIDDFAWPYYCTRPLPWPASPSLLAYEAIQEEGQNYRYREGIATTKDLEVRQENQEQADGLWLIALHNHQNYHAEMTVWEYGPTGAMTHWSGTLSWLSEDSGGEWHFLTDLPGRTEGDDNGDITRAIMQFLGGINVPCRYQTVIRSAEGFGPQRDGIRNVTRGKPIFRSIAVDRRYREYESSPDAEPVERAPHHRRGHIRHMWAAAGIDRHTLPRKPAERKRIARENNVREVYVKETWVGPRQFEHDGMEVEVPDQTALDVIERSE